MSQLRADSSAIPRPGMYIHRKVDEAAQPVTCPIHSAHQAMETGDIYTAEAVRCIRSLQAADGAAEPMPSKLTPLVSALTAMMHMARFVEEAARSFSDMGNISVLLSTKTERHGTAEGDLLSRVFHLWGPAAAAAAASRARNPALPPRDNVAEHAVRIERGNQPPAGIEGRGKKRTREETALVLAGDTASLPAASAHKAQRTLNGAAAVPAPQNVPGSELLPHFYKVPVEIAAQLSSYLSDGMGYTSHPSPFQDPKFSDFAFKTLEELVRKVRTLELEKCKVGGGLRNEKNCAEFPYKSLIPKELKCGEKILLPLVRLTRTEGTSNFELVKWLPVFLSVGKPDRNSKEANFALLCIHLHLYGKNGSAGMALEALSAAGLSADGCAIRKRYSMASTGKCGGATNLKDCTFRPRPTCTFYLNVNDTRRVAGTGTVDPRCAYFRGQVVPLNAYVVRFGTLDESAYVQGHLRVCRDGPVLWRRSDIGRVMLHGAYGEIGSAILADEDVKKEVEAYRSSRRGRPSRKLFRFDISKAMIVCDVKLNNSVRGATPYPYWDWYGDASMSCLSVLHFTDRNVPKILTDVTLGKTIALLWHSEKIAKG